MKLRFNKTYRIIAAMLLVAFLAQDISWAYPSQASNSNLAVPGLQNASVLSRLKKVLANKLFKKKGKSFNNSAIDTTIKKDPIPQNHLSANIVLPPDISAALKDIDEKNAKHIIEMIRRIDSHEKIGIMRQNHWLEYITGLLRDPRTQYKIVASKAAALIFEDSYHLDKMDEGSLRKAEEALLAALNDTNLQVRLAVISAMHKLVESRYDVRVYTLKQMAGRFDELIRKYHKVDATLEDAALRAMMALSSERDIELSSAYAVRAFDESLKAQAKTLGKNIRTFLKEERRSDFRMRGLSRVLDRCVADSGMGLTAYIRSVYFMKFIESLFSDEKTDIAKIKEYVLKLPRGSSNIDGRIIVYDPILKLADKELSEMYFTSGQDVRSLLSWRKDSEPVQAFDFYGEVFMTQSRVRFLEMADKGLVYYDANQKRFVTNPATFIDVASGETSMPDSDRITDGDALSMYIAELEAMECYIMSDAKSHEKNFLRPLFELLFNRLEKDFEGSEDFITYCRELIRRWPEGSYEIRKAMNDEEAILLEKFGKIKNSYATRNASIQLYGILLFYLTLKPQPYLGHLYDEYMKNSPPHNLSLYRTGISYHTRGDNVIYFFPKNLLFNGTNADALGKQRRGEAPFEDARKSENAAKILEAVKIWRRECPNLENRIKRFENNSTVSELIMKTSLIFSDPVHNVIRVVHAGRGRRLLFLPKNYLDSLRVDSEYDMKELAVWLNFAQRYLDIHDHMSGRKVAAHQVQKVLSELVRRSFEKEDTHLVEPEILKYRMSQLMKQDELIKYKDVLISLALEEAEVQVMEKISRPTKDELMILENAYGRIAHGYEVLGMKSRSERAYNGMADIITKIQSTDPWALPYELQVDLILTALRFGRWEDFINELKILLTGKGYPRDIRWTELSYIMKEIITPASMGPRSLESTIMRALAAQIAAADPRSAEVIKETADQANGMLSKYFKNPFGNLGMDDITGCPSPEALERLKKGEDNPNSLIDVENRLVRKVAGFESCTDIGRMDPYSISMTTRTANTLEGMGYILNEFRKPVGDAGISDAEVALINKSAVVVNMMDKNGHEQSCLLKILSREDPVEKAVENFLRNDLSVYEGLAKNNGCKNIILVLGKKHPSYPTNIIVPSERGEDILIVSYGSGEQPEHINAASAGDAVKKSGISDPDALEAFLKIQKEASLQSVYKAAEYFIGIGTPGAERLLKMAVTKKGHFQEEFLGEFIEARAVEDNIRYSRVIELGMERFGAEVDFVLEVDRSKYQSNTKGGFELEDGVYLGESKTSDKSNSLERVIEGAVSDKVERYLRVALNKRKSESGNPNAPLIKGIIFAIGGETVRSEGVVDFTITRLEEGDNLRSDGIGTFLALIPDTIVARGRDRLTFKERSFISDLLSDLKARGMLDSARISSLVPILKAALMEYGLSRTQFMISDAIKEAGADPYIGQTQNKEIWNSVFRALGARTGISLNMDFQSQKFLIDREASVNGRTDLEISYWQSGLSEFKNTRGRARCEFEIAGLPGRWVPLIDEHDQVVIAHISDSGSQKALNDYFVFRPDVTSKDLLIDKELERLALGSERLLYYARSGADPVPVRIPVTVSYDEKLTSNVLIGYIKAAIGGSRLLYYFGQQIMKSPARWEAWGLEPELGSAGAIKAVARPFGILGDKDEGSLVFDRHEKMARVSDIVVLDNKGKFGIVAEFGFHDMFQLYHKYANSFIFMAQHGSKISGQSSRLPQSVLLYADDIAIGGKKAARESQGISARKLILERLEQILDRASSSYQKEPNMLMPRTVYFMLGGALTADRPAYFKLPVIAQFRWHKKEGKYIPVKSGLKILEGEDNLEGLFQAAYSYIKRAEGLIPGPLAKPEATVAPSLEIPGSADILSAALVLGLRIADSVPGTANAIDDVVNSKALVLFADDILERGTAADLAYTLRESSTLNNSTIVLYGKRPGRAELLEKIISSSAQDKGIKVVKIAPEDLQSLNGGKDINVEFADETKELELLLRHVNSRYQINNGMLMGVIKGRTDALYESGIKNLAKEKHVPIVSFEHIESNDVDKEIYSFREALSLLISITNDTTPLKDREWFKLLRPIEKEDIDRIYQDYRRALEVAINA